MPSRADDTKSDTDASSPVRSRRRVWLFRGVAIFGALIVAAIIGEVAIRVFDLGPQIVPVHAENFRLSQNPKLRYELVPGSHYLGAEINAAGFRGRQYDLDKGDPVFRIACIGDSICFGFGARVGETFSDYLERMLNEFFAGDGQRFEVLNFGVTGYDTPQIIENYRVRARAYDPDLVIYAYTINDPQEFSLEFNALRARLTVAESDYFDATLDSGRRWLAKSRLYLLARYHLQAMTQAGTATGHKRRDRQWLSLEDGSYAQYYRNLHEGESWQRVTRGFDELDAMTEGGPEVVVALFPLLRDFDHYPLHGVHEIVAKAAAGHGFHVLNLFRYFDRLARLPGEPFAVDFLHPTGHGHCLAAVAMLKHLITNGLLPVDAKSLAPMRTSSGPEREFVGWVDQL